MSIRGWTNSTWFIVGSLMPNLFFFPMYCTTLLVCLSSFHLAIVLSVLPFMTFDYPFGVFKLLFRCVITITPTQRVVVVKQTLSSYHQEETYSRWKTQFLLEVYILHLFLRFYYSILEFFWWCDIYSLSFYPTYRALLIQHLVNK